MSGMRIIRPMVVNDAALWGTTIPENDYPAYNAGTTYALGARVIVVGTNVHKVYESLQGGNINHTPATSPTWWLDLGATNRWKMFDQSVTSQTIQANKIDVTIKASGRVNAVALVNISAVTARVTMIDATDGTVYSRIFNLVSSAGITNWYAYFFEPIVRKGDLVVLDMPSYYAPTIQVVLEAPGETVRCGALIIGQQVIVGDTQYGATLGIQDYSVKRQDDFGNYTVLERAFRKWANFSVFVKSGKVDQLQALLASYRATPTVYIGSDLYGAMIVYGFYKDFSITIAYARESVCNIELEGLT